MMLLRISGYSFSSVSTTSAFSSSPESVSEVNIRDQRRALKNRARHPHIGRRTTNATLNSSSLPHRNDQQPATMDDEPYMPPVHGSDRFNQQPATMDDEPYMPPVHGSDRFNQARADRVARTGESDVDDPEFALIYPQRDDFSIQAVLSSTQPYRSCTTLLTTNALL
jgi:hypothetical protein